MDFNPEEFEELLGKIDAAFVLAVSEESNERANKKVAEWAGRNSKVVGFGVVNPLLDPIGEDSIKKIRDMGLKGIVLSCPEFGLHPCHSKMMQFYENLQKFKMPLFFHQSGPYSINAVLAFAQPYLLDEVAREFPEQKILIGNYDNTFVGQMQSILQKHENVYATMTVDPKKKWQLYNLVLSAYEGEIMDKLVFGSGYPYTNISESVESLLGFNRLFADTQLPSVPRERIREIVERDSLEIFGLE